MNCYIGIKPCGCVTCAMVELPDDCKGEGYSEDIERTIKEWRKDGMSITLVDVEEARNRLKVCKHKQIQKELGEIKK
jgi:hypothetical protein